MKISLHAGGIKSLLLPGGGLFALAALLAWSGVSKSYGSVVEVCYYAAFLLGLLLAWRFHSSRVFSALIVVLLGRQAVAFFISQSHGMTGPGLTALEAVSFLVPVNFVLIAQAREQGIDVPTAIPKLVLLLLQSVFVAVICRPAPAPGSTLFHRAILDRNWLFSSRLPQIALLAFLIAAAILVTRGWKRSRPVEGGLLWAMAAFLVGLNAGAVNATAKTYVGMSAVILLAAVVETSYAMAYRDELTGLPSRRAFNGAKLRLESPYAMAGVDIDHFKSVNDTFGHDIGDEVLCLVASRLARVTGGGQAFRVGGEEFTILFPGKTAEEVLPDLEDLRAAIEASVFRLRGADRRAKPRGSDRRTGGKKSTRPRAYSSAAGELRVTVSIGVAEPAAEGASVEDVIRLSDQALYRAKKGGRNRIELAGEERSRARRRRKLSSSQD